MKRKIILLVPVALIALSIAFPVMATPAWYVQIQCEITGFNYVGSDLEGMLFDVTFEGVAN